MPDSAATGISPVRWLVPVRCSAMVNTQNSERLLVPGCRSGEESAPPARGAFEAGLVTVAAEVRTSLAAGIERTRHGLPGLGGPVRAGRGQAADRPRQYS
ncbi:hypothetical protein GCM10010387_50070 [Streptomyces inusitatus]|uniref:Uncharacterized protein n=1 Tax=Streptomyces inusitatus TaxID=68221 RepID=A0A918UZZ7_9ACTN|nr:hypothetical protein GCM10010387_50070 [Streptomyces inusitatus]